MPENHRLEIPVVAPAYLWMAVLGNMQLALRHPSNTGESAAIARLMDGKRGGSGRTRSHR
jgi:hypothetical protein